MNNPLIEQLAAGLKQEFLHTGRAVVLGIDGVPHSLLLKMISSGVMPNMAKFVEAGALVFLSRSDNVVERSSGAEKTLRLRAAFDRVPKAAREFAWNEEHRRSVFALDRRRQFHTNPGGIISPSGAQRKGVRKKL